MKWKRPKNTYFTAPWLKKSLLNVPVVSTLTSNIWVWCEETLYFESSEVANYSFMWESFREIDTLGSVRNYLLGLLTGFISCPRYGFTKYFMHDSHFNIKKLLQKIIWNMNEHEDDSISRWQRFQGDWPIGEVILQFRLLFIYDARQQRLRRWARFERFDGGGRGWRPAGISSFLDTFRYLQLWTQLSTGWPGCLVLKQGAVNQLFLGVFLMFLACLDHARWAKFHLGILGLQEWKKIRNLILKKG